MPAGLQGAGVSDMSGAPQLRCEHDAGTATAMQWETAVTTRALVDADGNGTADAQTLVVGAALCTGDFLVRQHAPKRERRAERSAAPSH